MSRTGQLKMFKEIRRRVGKELGSRVLSFILCALAALPNGPFVAAACAQVVEAPVAAAAATAVAPVVAATAPSPLSLSPAAALAGLAAPLPAPAALSAVGAPSSVAESAAPVAAQSAAASAGEAARSPWDAGDAAEIARTRPAAAAEAASRRAAAPAPGYAAYRAAYGAQVSGAQAFDGAAKNSSAGADAPVRPDQGLDPFGRDVGWNRMLPEPAEAPKSLAEVTLDPKPGMAYTPSPEDWRDETFYAVIADRFNRAGVYHVFGDPADGRTRHGGNIRGVIEKLDYLKGMGVTTLLINPVWMNPPLASHQYWAVHFMAVDPQLGTMADFQELVREAHKRGLHVVLDMVFNHTGPTIEYKEGFGFGAPKTIDHWNYAVKPAELARPEHFNRRGDIADWNDPEQKQFGDLPGGINSLATVNPATQDILLKIAKWWIKETDIDGFRLDVYKHVHPSFWPRLYSEVRAYASTLGKKNFFFVGELYDGDPNNLVPEVKSGRLDSAYNYPAFYWNFSALHGEAPTRKLEDNFHALRAALGEALGRLVHFVDNHDRYRFLRGRDESIEVWNDSDSPRSARISVDAKVTPPGTELVDLNDPNFKVTAYAEDGGSKIYVDAPPRGRRVLVRRWIQELHRLSPSRDYGASVTRLSEPGGLNAVSRVRAADPVETLRFALAFIMLSVGIPYIYYGDEQAFRHMPEREWLDLETSRDDMFSAGKFKNEANQDKDAFDPASPTYKLVAALNAVRRDHPALRRGEQFVRWSDPNGPGIYAFSRIYGNEEVLVVLNNADSQRSAQMWVDGGLTPGGTRLVDALDAGYSATSAAQNGGGSKVAVSVPAHGVRVLVRAR